ADVLLPGLQGEAVGDPALTVLGDADEAAGQRADVLLTAGDESGVWPAEPHGDSEALGGADGDVGTPLPRRRQQREGEQVGGGDHDGPRLLEPGGRLAVIDDGAGRARVGEQDAEGLLRV